jgi:hypothetical protein
VTLDSAPSITGPSKKKRGQLLPLFVPVAAAGHPVAGIQINQNITEGDNDPGYPSYTFATYTVEAKTGTDGRFRLDVPFGGVAFRLGFQRDGKPVEAVKASDALKVSPGETRDLGDIAIKLK